MRAPEGPDLDLEDLRVMADRLPTSAIRVGSRHRRVFGDLVFRSMFSAASSAFLRLFEKR